MADMRDIDRVLALLGDCVRECTVAYRHGDGLTHTTTRQVRDSMEEAITILESWPAKVYAIGIAPNEGELDG